MSVRRLLAEAGDAVTTGVAQLGVGLRLRLVIVGGVVLALAAATISGGVSPWILPALIGCGALVTAVRPDTHVAFGVIFAFAWYWIAHVDDGGGPWVLPAAAGLLVFHLATSAAALGPAEAELSPDLLVTWARRCVPVLGGTAALWLVTEALTRVDAGPNVVLTAAALAVVAGGGWLALSRSEPPKP